MQQSFIQSIVNSDPDFDLIGCSTNRLGGEYQLHDNKISDNDSIRYHMDIAIEHLKKYGTDIEIVPEDKIIAACFMLFRKSLWDKIKFEERSIQFDIIFNKKIRSERMKIGIARGIYIFHSYRLLSKDPKNSIGHIYGCHDMSKTINFD